MLVLHFVGSWDSAQCPVGSSRLRGAVGRDPQTGRGPTQLPIGRPVLRGEPLPTSGLSPLWDSPCECGCSDPPKLPTHSYNGSGGLRGHAWALPVRWHGNSKPQCGCRGAHLASPRRQGSLSSAGSPSFSFQVEGSGKVFRRLPGLGVPTGSVFLAFAPQRLGRCLALGGRWTFVEGVKKRVRGRGGAGERHSARAEASDPRLGRFRASPVPSRGHSRRKAWRMRSCSALRAERRCLAGLRP